MVELSQIKEFTPCKEPIGTSFLYGITIYEWLDLSTVDYDVYVMECDLDGKPLKENRVMFYIRGSRWYAWCMATKEMLGDPKALAFVGQRITHKAELALKEYVHA